MLLHERIISSSIPHFGLTANRVTYSLVSRSTDILSIQGGGGNTINIDFDGLDNDFSSTIKSCSLTCFGVQSINIFTIILYPALRSNQISALLKSHGNGVFVGDKILILIKISSRIGKIQLGAGEVNAFAGGNSVNLTRQISRRSRRIGVNYFYFYSHSHGANHDDSQYQCEYFFHCDFLL